MAGFGDSGTGGGAGCFPDPDTMTGTQVNGLISPMKALAARVHRQAVNQENLPELWFYRDSAWQLFPIQPVTTPGAEPEWTENYRQPNTLKCVLPDAFGFYTPENLNSPYNLNAALADDPLVDEARKIRLRVGSYCFYNIAAAISPTSTLAPSAGSLSFLTDGVMGNIASAVTSYAQFAPTTTAPFAITVDLGSAGTVAHLVIRFATKLGTGAITLPQSVRVSVSPDGTAWTDYPARPVGGIGGDWGDDYTGRTVEIALCDLGISGRYVKFTITPTGAQTIAIDELAIYGGAARGILGKNLFTGYLGDAIQPTPEGQLSFTATDVSKKCADNNESRLTAQFTNAELGDIAYSLLTSSGYWTGIVGAYDSPFGAGEVGWTAGANITGFIYPLWQGQGNSIYGYLLDTFNEIGFRFYFDGNGVAQASEPTYTQRLPDAAMIAAPDGNNNVRDCVRQRTGKEMRNTVEISSSGANGAGVRSVISEPNSRSKYGSRRVTISDPVATKNDLQTKIAQKILRDYAWRLQTLDCEIAPGYDTALKNIFGFRAPSRPNLFTKASNVTGARRKGELWSLESLVHKIGVGDWKADAHFIPYVPAGPNPPDGLTLTPTAGVATTLVSWAALTDATAVGVILHVSTTSATTGFAAQSPVYGTQTSISYFGGTVGSPIWVYLTSVDRDGNEGLSSLTVSALVGGSAAGAGDWAVIDLAANVNPPSPASSNGTRYTYEFFEQWTAPAAGYKRMNMHFAIGSLPSNPNDANQWQYQDEFHGDYNPPGTILTWYPRIEVTGALAAGTRVYFRMKTSDKNTSNNGVWPWSNICYATIP